MNDWNIIGHDWAVRRLQSAIERGQLAQSHLFVGPPYVGKAALAKAVARALLGRDDRTRRLVDANRHPDMAWVQPDGDTIKVEQIRELLHTLTLAPVESRNRVAVIDQAHAMSDGGKNAILKTLEEPNPSVVIILIAPGVESVLPTISSRCQVTNLRPAPIHAIETALTVRGVELGRAAFVARLSRGRAGWALRAVQDEDLLDARAQHLNDLRELMSANRTARFAYAEKLARKDGSDITSVLDDWLLLWRDVTHADGQPLNSDYAELIDTLAEHIDPARAAELMRSLSDTIQHLDHNVNARLALDVLLLKFPRLSPLPIGEG